MCSNKDHHYVHGNLTTGSQNDYHKRQLFCCRKCLLLVTEAFDANNASVAYLCNTKKNNSIDSQGSNIYASIHLLRAWHYCCTDTHLACYPSPVATWHLIQQTQLTNSKPQFCYCSSIKGKITTKLPYLNWYDELQDYTKYKGRTKTKVLTTMTFFFLHFLISKDEIWTSTC